MLTGGPSNNGPASPLPDINQNGLLPNHTNSASALNVVRDLHEIDTKKFLSEHINQDINKFRNAEAFVNAGRERMQSLPGSQMTRTA